MCRVTAQCNSRSTEEQAHGEREQETMSDDFNGTINV